MMVVDPNGAVAESDLVAFEREFGIVLPASYRDWLAATGGGETDLDYEVENGVVSGFLRLAEGTRANLAATRTNTTGFPAHVPREWLVVSYGSGGELAVLLGGQDAGSLWWADYDAVVDLGGDAVDDEAGNAVPMPQIMSRLADSLPAFLQEYTDPNEDLDD